MEPVYLGFVVVFHPDVAVHRPGHLRSLAGRGDDPDRGVTSTRPGTPTATVSGMAWGRHARGVWSSSAPLPALRTPLPAAYQPGMSSFPADSLTMYWARW